MYANNEIGTVQPIAEIGALCRERGVPLHVDAVQAVGWLPLDVEAIGADLLSISGHKFGGPKGVGALFVRHGTPLAPLIDGGAQERRRRAGTENVPGVVGLAAALRLAVDEADGAARHCRRLRDRLEGALVGAVPHTIVNGDPEHRLPNHLHVTFDGVEGDATTEGLVALLDAEGVCVASGSACNSRALEPSHVLRAIGRTPAQAFSSVRFTLGKATTDAEIDRVAAALPPLVGRLRRVSTAYQRLTNEER
jgi:cysteine desulfurase